MKFKQLGVHAAEKISNFIGGWIFVFLYTLLMASWIAFHELKILHLDNADYLKWNLFLSYFTVCQGSLILLAANKQAELDRHRWNSNHQESLNLDKEHMELSKFNTLKMFEIIQQIDKIEEALDLIIQENED
jgi:uncharacterized membrane protein